MSDKKPISELDLLKEKYRLLEEESNRKINVLQEEVFGLKNELSHIKNSKLIKKALLVREGAGSARKKFEKSAHVIKRLPHTTLHKVRVVVAPAVPQGMRKKAKASYKTYKANALERRTSLVVTVNKKVDSKLPVLSVVIPFYNRESTIDETLRSLSAQTFTNFETIIIDDGSTDKASIQKLLDIAKSNPSIRIVHQKNQGVAAARNNGILNAKGRYVICLDSDDLIAPTFIEKSIITLDTNPSIDIVTSHVEVFGVVSGTTIKSPYDPEHLFSDNMVITAAAFRKSVWENTGGYKSDIGYEDWEFWITLAENGHWGKLLPESLFEYRTATQSRYIEDKGEHWNNIQLIRSFHPKYKRTVRKLLASRKYTREIVEPNSAFVNLNNEADYLITASKSIPRVLITIPWMTFGGAEMLIYNFCSEIKGSVDLSFITGLESANEWEYKFRELTPNIYHLANLFEDKMLWIDFISNYISTRQIDILHVIHNGFTFEMLPELKKRHPKLKVIVTMFNDRVEYFEQSVGYQKYIDVFTSDNSKVENHYKKLLTDGKTITIPNGIDIDKKFNPVLFNSDAMRESLSIEQGDIACFFIGRLSPEKNPDVFVDVAKRFTKGDSKYANLKFFVIGDGPMNKEIVRSIDSIKSKNITYLGYKAEVAQYLSAADIFVLPSSIEGFPLSLLEAMGMGVVSIASNVGAVNEVLSEGETGFVINPPGSAEHIAEVIKCLHVDTQKIDEIGRKARSVAREKYSSTILGDKYLKLYRSVKK